MAFGDASLRTLSYAEFQDDSAYSNLETALVQTATKEVRRRNLGIFFLTASTFNRI